jgi:HK97 family phage portal protein
VSWWRNLLQRAAATPAPRAFEDVIARLDGDGADVSDLVQTLGPLAALQVSTVQACVKAIADGCATPALHLYRELADGTRQLATNIPEYRLLHRRPNEWQTSFEFRRTLTLHAALTGNGLALKVRSGNRVRELIPVVPGRYAIERTSRYEVLYRIHDEWGHVGDFRAADVLHLPNWQWDWLKGMPAVRLAAAAIGLAVAAETSQQTLHKHGGQPRGLLSTDEKLSPDAIDRLREAWERFSRAQRHGTAVLDAGMKYQPLAMTGVDAQHLETRRLQVEEICRAFGVFPIMVGHSDKSATFASSEAFFAAHLVHTLAPWHQLWLQRLDETVLDGSGPLFAEFDTRYLRAGSMKDRAVWARTMAELGIYTRNELRDEEGRDPLPGLDEPLTPLNMAGGGANGPGSDPEPAADPPADPPA